MKRNQNTNNNAVTEILGTMLLLLIAIGLFSVVYYSVLTIPKDTSTPQANIAFSFTEQNITLTHYKGNALDPNTNVIILIDEMEYRKRINEFLDWDSNGNNLWNIGETITFDPPAGPSNLYETNISVNLVDDVTNSLVLQGTFNQDPVYSPSLATSLNPLIYTQLGPSVTLSAAGDMGLNNVSLTYRYSTDNSSWSNDLFYENDTSYPWEWTFSFPQGTGYYEFYSRGFFRTKSESIPSNPDTRCLYTKIPVITDYFPCTCDTDVDLEPTLFIMLSDGDCDGSCMDLSWFSNASGSWQKIGSNTSIGNGTYTFDTIGLMNAYDTTYYWNASVSDETSTVQSPLYYFTTRGVNAPPAAPSNPDPLDQSLDVSLGPYLNWSCSDPDGDDLTYDVYLDSFTPPITKISDNQTQTDCYAGELSSGQTYYWKIVAWDDQGAKTEGDIWEFTTLDWTLITYDDFESGWGNYTDNGGDCHLYTGGTFAYQGSNAANIEKSGSDASFVYTNGKDVSSFSTIKIDFWFRSEGMENGEYFRLWYFDGTFWQDIEEFVKGTDYENEVFIHEIIWINATDYTFPSDMEIGFRCYANYDNDDVYIDEIYVWAK